MTEKQKIKTCKSEKNTNMHDLIMNRGNQYRNPSHTAMYGYMNSNYANAFTYKCMCDHRNINNNNVVITLDNGNVYCPICDKEWDPNLELGDTIEKYINYLLNDIQNINWLLTCDSSYSKDLYDLIKLLNNYCNIRSLTISTTLNIQE